MGSGHMGIQPWTDTTEHITFPHYIASGSKMFLSKMMIYFKKSFMILNTD